MEQIDTIVVIQQFAEMLVAGLGARGVLALETAMKAAHIDGLGGVVILSIPEMAKRSSADRRDRTRELWEAEFKTGCCTISMQPVTFGKAS